MSSPSRSSRTVTRPHARKINDQNLVEGTPEPGSEIGIREDRKVRVLDRRARPLDDAVAVERGVTQRV